MRVIACFLVLVVHSVEPFYLGGEGSQMQSGTEAVWAAVFLALSRACVALFVVASAYLQFPLHYDTGTFLKRRAVRILVPFAVWTAPAEILLTAVCSYVCTAVCAVLIRKIPKIGKYIIG